MSRILTRKEYKQRKDFQRNHSQYYPIQCFTGSQILSTQFSHHTGYPLGFLQTSLQCSLINPVISLCSQFRTLVLVTSLQTLFFLQNSVTLAMKIFLLHFPQLSFWKQGWTPVFSSVEHNFSEIIAVISVSKGGGLGNFDKFLCFMSLDWLSFANVQIFMAKLLPMNVPHSLLLGNSAADNSGCFNKQVLRLLCPRGRYCLTAPS